MKIELNEREVEELERLLDFATSSQKAVDCDRSVLRDIEIVINDAKWEEFK